MKALQQGVPLTVGRGVSAGVRPTCMVWRADAWAVHCALVSPPDGGLLGYPADAWSDTPGFLRDHIPADDWPRLVEAMARAAAEGDAPACEHRVVRRDGSTAWVLTSLHRSRSNGTVELTGLTVDISDAREREQALRTAEARQRMLVESLREHALFMIAPGGDVATWSAAARRLTGHDADQVLDRPFAAFFAADERERGTPQRLLEEATSRMTSSHDTWLVRDDGTVRCVRVTVNAMLGEAGQVLGYSCLAHDVTDRWAEERTLRVSETQFRLLVGSLHDHAMFMLSPDGLIESWNQGAQRLKGYREHEIVGEPLDRLFPPDGVERGVVARLLHEADMQGSSTYEGWLLRKDGSQFWGTTTISAVEEPSGVLRGFANVARDLTERKRQEDSVRASEERLRLLIDTLQDYAVFMLTPDGVVDTWSPGAERLAGHDAAEVVGTPFARLFPPDDAARGLPERLVERATAEGRVEVEGWLVRRSGANLWGSVLLTAVKDADGRLRGISVVARDLTDRRRADAARAFLSDVSDVLAASLDYRTTLDRVAHLATRDLALWCVIHTRVGDALAPVAVAHVDRATERRLSDALAALPAGGSVRGRLGTVLLGGQPVLDADPATGGWMGDLLGVDDPALARELLTRSSMCVPLVTRGATFGSILFMAPPGKPYTPDDLLVAQELARRAALAIENARLYDEAQGAVRLRDEMLAVVSHDLRNPLMTVQMAASQIQKGDASHEPAAVTAARISRAGARMNRMIQDLLDVASVEAGRLRVEVLPCDAEALAVEAIDALTPVAGSEGVRLETDLELAGVRVLADRQRIAQVFSNLVGNAIRFTPKEGSIVVAGRVRDREVVYAVVDRGPGLSAEESERMFHRYWRGAARSGTDRGLGLGLTIARGIVDAHGGRVWVESAVGVGTTMSFSLPLA